MRPLMLKFNGINSYEQEQIIDFKALTDKGIFGIFGPTGSGKSTIIEAILLALYGKMSRYNTNGIKECINTNSNKLYVVFEFSIKSGKEDKVYVVERAYKLDKKDSLNQSISRFYSILDSQKTVIADTAKTVDDEVKNVIGIEYNDFIKSVVLPQGKFSEFLLLENLPKREMLERIFGLENYGSVLIDRFKVEYDKSKTNIEDMQKKINIYGDVSEDIIINESAIYEEVSNQIKNLKVDYNNKLNEKNFVSNLIITKKQYNDFLKQKAILDNKTSEIESYKMKVAKSERAKKVFPLIEEVNNYTNELNDTSKLLYKEETELCNIIENYNKSEQDYNNALTIRLEREIELISKNKELTDIKIISDEVSDLSIKRNKINKEYLENQKSILELSEKITNIESETKGLNEELLRLKESKEEVNVSIEYRSSIELLAEKEKSFEELANNIKELRISILDKKDKLLKLIEEHKEIVIELENNNSELNDYKSKLEKVKMDCPENLEYIFQRENLFIHESAEYKDKHQKRKKYSQTIENKEKLEKENIENKVRIDSIIKELNLKNELFRKVMLKIELLKNEDIIITLAELLEENKPCPVCGSLNHPNIAKLSNEVLDNIIKEKDDIEDRITNLLDEQKELEKLLSSNNIMIENYNNSLNEIIDETKDYNFNERKEYLIKEKEDIDNLKDIIKKADKDKENYSTKLNLVKENLAALSTKKIEREKDINDKEKDILNLEEEIKLLDKQCMQDKEFINKSKSDFDIISFKDEYSLIKEKEKIKAEIELNEKEKQESINKNLEIFNQRNLKLNQYNNILIEQKIQIETLENHIDDKKIKIQSVTNGRNIDNYITEVKETLHSIVSNESLCKEKLEKLKIKKEYSERNKIKLNTQINSISNILKEKVNTLSKLMEENDFTSNEEVVNSICEQDDYQNLKKEIECFDDEIKKVNNNIERVADILKDTDINCIDQKFTQITKETKELEELINIQSNSNILRKNKIENLKETFDKVKELSKVLKKERHYNDLLLEIRSVIDAKKFAEYVAKRHLQYITREASERLEYISNNKYSLALDDVNFSIVDKRNGNKKRSPKTLSGGERFLASLSLALALSSKIHMKSSAPLEVFFLDEGFGTLDNELLATVMNSLIKLRADNNISVGIITHVEELKNKIQSKIIVQPQNGVNLSSSIYIE